MAFKPGDEWSSSRLELRKKVKTFLRKAEASGILLLWLNIGQERIANID